MVALVLILLLGACGIFLLPWFVPPRLPVQSASYVLGFNNQVAVLALGALLAALLLFLLRRSTRQTGEFGRILASLLSVSAPDSGSRSLTAVFVSTAALLVAALLAWYRLLPLISYGEFGSDVSRLELMVLGLRPYRDFQYNYGPAMLYPAYWLYHLAGGRMSIDGAYCANLLLHWLAGLSLLFFTVRNLCSGLRGTIVFLCVSLAVFNPTMGAGYSPLRFVVPLALPLLLRRAFETRLDKGAVAVFGLSGLALLLSLAALFLSPEVGVSTAAGIAIFFLALLSTPHRRFSVAALAPVLAFVLTAVLLSASYAEAIVSFGSGANNFPVFPTPHTVFLVAAAALVLPHLGVVAARERDQVGALAAALAVALGLMLAGAFGRCDPTHLHFNGLGVLLLFLAAAVQSRRKGIAGLTLGVYLAVFPLLGVHLLFDQRDVLFRQPLALRQSFAAIPADHNERRWQAIAADPVILRYGKLLPFREDLRQLLQFGPIGTPFYTSEDVDRFLKLSGRYVPEYYAGINIQVYTPAALERKIRDLRLMDTVLVPKSLLGDARAGHPRPAVVLSEASPAFLSALLFFPERLVPRPRRPPYAPGVAIIDRIRENFTLVGHFRAWEIWRRHPSRRQVDAPVTDSPAGPGAPSARS